MYKQAETLKNGFLPYYFEHRKCSSPYSNSDTAEKMKQIRQLVNDFVDLQVNVN